MDNIQFSSVTQSCLTLCDPRNCSTPGLPVHHQLLEFTQTHVHWVGDAIQPSHPLSSPSPPAFNLSQHQGLFKWELLTSGGQSIGVSASASVLPMNTQDWSPLGWTGWISLQSKGLSRLFSNPTVQKHQFFGSQLSLIVQLGGSDGKVSAYNAGDLGLIPGSGRSPGEGNGSPLQYFCLENPMDKVPGRLQSMGLQRVGHNWVTSLHFTSHIHIWLLERPQPWLDVPLLTK